MNGDETTDNERLDGLLDQMRPRMVAARRSHLHRLAGIAILVPGLLLGGGAAWATTRADDGGAAVEVAGPATEQNAEESVLDEVETAPESETNDEDPAEPEAPTDVVMTASLGLAGTADYTRHDDVLVLGKVETNDGWTATVLAAEAPTLVIFLEHESGSQLVASIGRDDEGEPVVRLVTPRSEPEPEPTTEPTPEPEADQPEQSETPAVETRKEIDVNGYGRVVVERDGNAATLWIGILSTAEGWQSKVLVEHGEVVKAKFFNEQYIKTVKAWAGDDGRIHHEILVDERAQQPEPQMRKEIDVNGYGRVVVERDSNGLLWIAILSTAEGWQSQVLVQHGEVVKAEFFDEQYIKTVKAWVGDDGRIHHDILVEELAPLPPAGTYDGVVNTELGSFGVVVENRIATIVWVEAAIGLEYTIVQETGEVVKVTFTNGEQTWLVTAWGHNGEVVKEVSAA